MDTSFQKELASKFKCRDPETAVMTYAKAAAEHVWKVLPDSIRVVMHPNYGITKRRDMATLAQWMYGEIWSRGNLRRQPRELAYNAVRQRIIYGQCLIDHHYLYVFPTGSLQEAYLLDSTTGLSLNLDNFVHEFNLAKQIGLCDDHNHNECPSCTRKFTVMDEDRRFWLDPSGECPTCLKKYMVYSEIKHNARDQVVRDARGRRQLHRFIPKDVPALDIPTGPAPSVGITIDHGPAPSVNQWMLNGHGQVVQYAPAPDAYLPDLDLSLTEPWPGPDVEEDN